MIRHKRDEEKWHAYMVAAISAGNAPKAAAEIADGALDEYVDRCKPVGAELSRIEILARDILKAKKDAEQFTYERRIDFASRVNEDIAVWQAELCRLKSGYDA